MDFCSISNYDLFISIIVDPMHHLGIIEAGFYLFHLVGMISNEVSWQ
jgi:hypothetical protein